MGFKKKIIKHFKKHRVPFSPNRSDQSIDNTTIATKEVLSPGTPNGEKYEIIHPSPIRLPVLGLESETGTASLTQTPPSSQGKVLASVGGKKVPQVSPDHTNSTKSTENELELNDDTNEEVPSMNSDRTDSKIMAGIEKNIFNFLKSDSNISKEVVKAQPTEALAASSDASWVNRAIEQNVEASQDMNEPPSLDLAPKVLAPTLSNLNRNRSNVSAMGFETPIDTTRRAPGPVELDDVASVASSVKSKMSARSTKSGKSQASQRSKARSKTGSPTSFAGSKLSTVTEKAEAKVSQLGRVFGRGGADRTVDKAGVEKGSVKAPVEQEGSVKTVDKQVSEDNAAVEVTEEYQIVTEDKVETIDEKEDKEEAPGEMKAVKELDEVEAKVPSDEQAAEETKEQQDSEDEDKEDGGEEAEDDEDEQELKIKKSTSWVAAIQKRIISKSQSSDDVSRKGQKVKFDSESHHIEDDYYERHNYSDHDDTEDSSFDSEDFDDDSQYYDDNYDYNDDIDEASYMSGDSIEINQDGAGFWGWFCGYDGNYSIGQGSIEDSQEDDKNLDDRRSVRSGSVRSSDYSDKYSLDEDEEDDDEEEEEMSKAEKAKLSRAASPITKKSRSKLRVVSPTQKLPSCLLKKKEPKQEQEAKEDKEQKQEQPSKAQSKDKSTKQSKATKNEIQEKAPKQEQKTKDETTEKAPKSSGEKESKQAAMTKNDPKEKVLKQEQAAKSQDQQQDKYQPKDKAPKQEQAAKDLPGDKYQPREKGPKMAFTMSSQTRSLRDPVKENLTRTRSSRSAASSQQANASAGSRQTSTIQKQEREPIDDASASVAFSNLTPYGSRKKGSNSSSLPPTHNISVPTKQRSRKKEYNAPGDDGTFATGYTNGKPSGTRKDSRQLDIYCKNHGGAENLALRKYPTIPQPAEKDHVLVKVEASTVSSRDCLIRLQGDKTRQPSPAVPGFQIVGTIQALGARLKYNGGLKVGDRVAALTQGGGNARFTSIPAADAILLPETATSENTICLVSNYMTAFQALKMAKMKKGGAPLMNTKVLVTGGSGPIGQALIDLASREGAIVHTTAHPMHQEHLTKNLKALWYPVNPNKWLPKLEGKMDVVVDSLCVDGYESSYRALTPDGVLICTGNITAEMDKGQPSSLLDSKNLSLWWSDVKARHVWKNCYFYNVYESFANDPKVFQQELLYLYMQMENGGINPKVAGRVSLNQVPKAQRLIEKGLPNGTVILNPWKRLDPKQNVPIEKYMLPSKSQGG